ncbi:hypothetical protein PIB30_113198, partial [Stylosanthes scabra]|nr:hypothetical protein [Stylosanthes scabra]
EKVFSTEVSRLVRQAAHASCAWKAHGLVIYATHMRGRHIHMRGRHTASMKMSSQSCSNMARSPEDPRICVEVHA